MCNLQNLLWFNVVINRLWFDGHYWLLFQLSSFLESSGMVPRKVDKNFSYLNRRYSLIMSKFCAVFGPPLLPLMLENVWNLSPSLYHDVQIFDNPSCQYFWLKCTISLWKKVFVIHNKLIPYIRETSNFFEKSSNLCILKQIVDIHKIIEAIRLKISMSQFSIPPLVQKCSNFTDPLLKSRHH